MMVLSEGGETVGLEIEGRLLAETRDAIRVGGDWGVLWLPRRRVRMEILGGGEGAVLVRLPMWLARRKGLMG